MKKIFLFLFAALLLTDVVQAGDLFQITGLNTLIKAHRSDPVTFIALKTNL